MKHEKSNASTRAAPAGSIEESGEAPRKAGRQAGYIKIHSATVEADKARVMPTIDRLRAMAGVGISILTISKRSGVSKMRLYRAAAIGGESESYTNSHATFTDKELAALNKVMDDIKSGM